ncbi:hypothetical protein EV699_110137 [Plasticicumulans lactativorans]|uniref:Uncharacterized protein n=1 Tax=Plasticicumulans lactativorans TaxID=1133106 RepID=A0A4R2L229_9GAMM|nr:hypothetical protein [Plasticicumulans lactativorans]TCO81111.1 hypothetical protein EV699_110137 [Plasticicumulans lactativorans]
MTNIELLQKFIAKDESSYSYWVASAAKNFRKYRQAVLPPIKAMYRQAVRFDLQMARSARAELRKWNAELLAELDRQPAPVAPVVRVVSAVPVAPVQLTLAGDVDPIPAPVVRPSWYSRRVARGPSRWCAGMSL